MTTSWSSNAAVLIQPRKARVEGEQAVLAVRPGGREVRDVAELVVEHRAEQPGAERRDREQPEQAARAPETRAADRLLRVGAGPERPRGSGAAGAAGAAAAPPPRPASSATAAQGISPATLSHRPSGSEAKLPAIAPSVKPPTERREEALRLARVEQVAHRAPEHEQRDRRHLLGGDQEAVAGPGSMPLWASHASGSSSSASTQQHAREQAQPVARARPACRPRRWCATSSTALARNTTGSRSTPTRLRKSVSETFRSEASAQPDQRERGRAPREDPAFAGLDTELAPHAGAPRAP